MGNYEIDFSEQCMNKCYVIYVFICSVLLRSFFLLWEKSRGKKKKKKNNIDMRTP
jgi:hypothetical protein